MNLQNLVRENIKSLTPYSSARTEFKGTARIFLDANENNFGSPIGENYHRYPDPMQNEIKEKLARLNGVQKNEIFIGNGSDEAIDLLFRIFCKPGKENIIICPPTYGMYEVSAAINDISVRRANLTRNFGLDLLAIKNVTDVDTKLLFICSPNNPTGNSMDRKTILNLVENFDGIVVIDEAYIHFSKEQSFVSKISSLKNLVVLQTFSKAWGLAGLRVGSAFANSEIIKLLNKVKPPYNVSEIAQEAILESLQNRGKVEETVIEIIREREKLIENLAKLEIVAKIYPTDANFVLVKMVSSDLIYRYLIAENIIVRNRNNVEMCGQCLRITIGTPSENESLLKALGNFYYA